MNELRYNKKEMILDTWKMLKLDEEFDKYDNDSSDYEIKSKYDTDND